MLSVRLVKSEFCKKCKTFSEKKFSIIQIYTQNVKERKTILSEKQGVLFLDYDVDVHALADDFHRLKVVCRYRNQQDTVVIVIKSLDLRQIRSDVIELLNSDISQED